MPDLMRISRRLALAGVAATFLLLTIGIAQPVEAQSIIFIEIGDHSMECEAGESITYQWFFYNDMNVSYLFEASVDVVSDTGWESELSPLVAVLDPGDALLVELTVTAENSVSSKEVSQVVTFVLTDLSDSYAEIIYTGTAETEMVPLWGVVAPGRNKLLGQFDNPLPEPFDDNYMTFLLNIGIWACIALFIAYVVDPAIRMFTKRTKTDIDDRIMKVMRKPVFVLIMVFGVVQSLTILQLSESQVSSVFQVYGVVLISVLTYVVYKVFKEVLVHLGMKWSQRTSTEIDDVLIPVIDKIGGIVILIFGGVAVVNYMGYDITFLLAGVGVFGLVIAFAAQDVLSNFFSGIFLLLDRPFSEGEFITIPSGELCRVEKIGIRSTRLYEVFQNDYIILPNNKLINDKIVNLVEPDLQAKTNVAVGVAYGTDVEKVERILKEIAAAHPNVVSVAGKEPVVRFTNFADSSLEFKLFVWVDNLMNQWAVAHDLRKAINKRFADEAIEIPFPQRTVHIMETKDK